ncbi:hypothetical protein HNQ77_000957 [Silvibacterium bohemicum]|uniref:Uncharacterized protein n=1 Tax=Silvibacterium bohemicum TaxID=1577686 RepID=A0A841JP07_9BACT|nr:hypothetical protein [Silvibacterium bohemicum]MBB6143013.1 hypothetical protein [Silvibacterium bohemicum]
MRIRISALFLSVALSAVTVSAQASQVFTGAVSDAMCAGHHMMQGKGLAQCIRECVKQGSDFVLVSKEQIYSLKGDKAQFDKFAGQNVTVGGEVSGSTLTVEFIEAAKQ